MWDHYTVLIALGVLEMGWPKPKVFLKYLLVLECLLVSKYLNKVINYLLLRIWLRFLWGDHIPSWFALEVLEMGNQNTYTIVWPLCWGQWLKHISDDVRRVNPLRHICLLWLFLTTTFNAGLQSFMLRPFISGLWHYAIDKQKKKRNSSVNYV